MKHNQIFTGQNSDTSKLYMSNKEYLKALNFRPITTSGDSNGSMVNILGNVCTVGFPKVYSVYKINCNINSDSKITITVNGQTTPQININSSTTAKDLLTNLQALSNCYNGVYSTSKTFTACVENDNLFIYQQPYYTDCNPQNSSDPVISINLITGTEKPMFVDLDDNTYSSQTPFINGDDSNDKTIVIGSTKINNVSYLLTCGKNNPNKTGQVWSLEYNESTETSVLKLLYHSKLNLSIDYPVSNVAFVGRYETSNIERIYWSDFNNPVRSVNVKNPNLMGLDSKQTDLMPALELSIPTLNNVTDNDAVTPLNTEQTIQCAYRLTKNNGAVTNYSITSDVIYPTKHDIGQFIGTSPNYSSLDGEVGSTNKSYTFRVDGIDNSYDNIEFVIILRNSNNAYTIFKYDTQLIGNATTILSTFKNNVDDFEEISIDEFNINNAFFTHAKTIEQKDNRLFFGNVRNALTEYLESFDTRAYRFSTSSDNIKVKKKESDSTCTVIDTVVDGYPTDETEDLIPSINLGMSTSDDSEYDALYKYQRNSTIIGGTGPNVSFKFGALAFKSDVKSTTLIDSTFTDINSGTERDGSTCDYPHGFRVPGAGLNSNPLITTYSKGSPNQEYNVQNYKHSFGLEYYNSFKGYQLNEIYRIGVQFYSKNGSTFFTKWIADIKFPNYNDNPAPGFEAKTDAGTIIPDFRSCYIEGSNAYTLIPYLVVEINIPKELANLIDGYEIVRVNRSTVDRSIAAQGLITQTQQGKTSGNLYLPVSNNFRNGGSNLMDIVSGVGGSPAYASRNEISFTNFEYLVDQSENFNSTDKLIITEKYKSVAENKIWAKSSTIPAEANVTKRYSYMHLLNKFYNLTTFVYDPFSNTDIYPITGGKHVGINEQITTANGNTYFNRDWYYANPLTNADESKGFAMGASTHIVSLSQDLNWENYNAGLGDVSTSPFFGYSGDSKLLALHYKPRVLKSQYGGRTYLQRLNNEYISCGAFYKVTGSGSTTLQVFGGDTYCSIYDIQKALKQNDPSKAYETTDKTHSQIWFFPHQCNYNIELRNGAKANSDLNEVSSTTSAIYTEQNLYTPLYSFANDLRKYVLKPLNFNSDSNYYNYIYWSDVKYNGESNDTWGYITSTSFYRVDGNYGPINALITLQNNMYVLQSNALGVLQINPVAIITDNNDQSLKLGSGDVLNKHLYYSVDVGSTQQFSISKSSSAITFIDSKTKKIYTFDGSSLIPISDVKNHRGFMNKVMYGDLLKYDNPVKYKGVLTTYDFINNEFLYTFLNGDDKYTLAFSNLFNNFTGFYSFTPYIYINSGNHLYSLPDYNNSLSKLYIHNKGEYCKFYDTVYPSTIKVAIAPDPKNTKIFDNISWNSESIKIIDRNIDEINNSVSESLNIPQLKDTISSIRVYNEYQNSDWVSLDKTPITGNLRRLEQSWNTVVPRNKVNYDTNSIGSKSIFDSSILTKTTFKDRLRDKYIVIDLNYDNSNNNRLTLHNMSVDYRVSDR